MSYVIEGGGGPWEVVIGLEVHAQVVSRAKLFSGAAAAFGAEPNAQVSFVDAAFPGMLPVINQMVAAGIVTLPGIMTGQILAGMDPLEAVKYQILLMFLLAGAGGLVAVTVVLLAACRFTDDRQRLRLDRLR